MKKARIAVFVSGGGTNLEALLKAQEAGMIPHGEIVLVCASNESAYALTRAANHGVPGVAVPKSKLTQAEFEDALMQHLTAARIDVIVPKADAEAAIAALDCGAYVIGEIVAGEEKVELC